MTPRPILAFLAALCLLPDEGQWLPTQVREMDWAALEQRGMKLSKDEFWHPERGGVLSATVQINGCTASFCSPKGLLVTNHHCGFSAVTALSTTEHNYLENGFAAATWQDELPAPGVVAYVLKRIENVTDKVHAAQAAATSDLDRWSITQRTIAELVSEGERSEANTDCSVASFLEGKEYHLYYRTRITDVRLVYAPPRAVGEYGGEVDNWEWPRHTGDFTFFRAYVAPDGTVRDHDPANVPYEPEHHLQVSTDGLVARDLAIIMGYPGRTQRYETSRGVAMQESYVYPKRADVLGRAIDVLTTASATDEATALRFVDRIKSLANVEKNARGMVFGLANNGTVAKKLHEEEELRKWTAADAARQDRFGDVLDGMLAADDEIGSTIERDTMIWFTLRLAGDAPVFVGLLQAAGALAQGDKVPPRLQRALAAPALADDWDSVQRPMLEILIGEYAAMSDGQRIPGLEFLASGDFADDPVGTVFGRTRMAEAEARTALLEGARDGGADAFSASDDPIVRIAAAIGKERDAWDRRRRERDGRMLDLGRRWIAAQEAFRGKSFYPDANSTLRVSIAEVQGYVPKDGVYYTPHTTVAGLLAKETGEPPFRNPPALLAAAEKRMASAWVDPRLGDVPVCFLTNGDTTGGNSGSPVIDGRGRLVGLNFDRVFEAVAGDFGWSPALSRNVVVDIRYALWIIDEVFPCPRLLEEMGGRPKQR
ncbi:MAG: S46 family peptidase [Planctomycetes bacterium]|nr:S46 family peptidase [Planctomycetota bacterium]